MQPPTLRPLGIGDIVDAVFTLVRSRPLIFITIAALPQLVYQIVARLLGFAETTSLRELTQMLTPSAFEDAPPPTVTPEDVTNVVGLGLVFFVLAIVVFTIQAGALVEATARRYLGEEVTIGEALRAALQAAPRLVGAGLLAFLVIVVVMTVAMLAFIILAFLGAAALGVIGPLLAIFALLVMVGALFFLLASWLVAPVVVMREGAGPIAALRRSWALSSGSRWRVLGLLALLIVLQIVIGALFSVLFLASFVAEPTMSTLLQEGANLLAAAVSAPLQWATFTLLYYDLRVRREAFDLRLAAEALPRGV